MATQSQLSWSELVLIARRTGVENWVGKDYNGNTVRGKVIEAPSSWRGRKGSMGSVLGPTRHHTGTPETYLPSSDYPTYNVVKEGRSGLDNSLSAYGLGRWYGLYVFSEYLSWHAGSWYFAGTTDGNGHFLGIEAEGTGARWTPFQQEFYPRLTASILLYVGEGFGMMPRHADGAMPRGRKSDAANLPLDFTSRVAGYLATPSTLTYGGNAAPPPVAQEEEEMLIVYVGSQPYIKDGLHYQALADGETVASLKKAGVKTVNIGPRDHDRWVGYMRGAGAIPPPPEA